MHNLYRTHDNRILFRLYLNGSDENPISKKKLCSVYYIYVYVYYNNILTYVLVDTARRGLMNNVMNIHVLLIYNNIF